MESCYRIDDTSRIISPALIVFRELVERNLDEMIRMAGRPERLRPHCKTHKMADVTQIELAKGIRKHKCATLAEAEMLARAGVTDILLAYNLVGPNVARALEFIERFPEVVLSVTADHGEPVRSLSQAAKRAGRSIDVLLDLDVGQLRTGLPVGDAAAGLYRDLASLEGLRPGGLHVYDGHQHQTSFAERQAGVAARWAEVVAFRDRLLSEGLPVPRIVAGGTPTFPVYCTLDEPTLEVSPGTCVFSDAGYGEAFPELRFRPAVLLLTRVISCPASGRITLDLGYKAVASDPPVGRRVVFPELRDARELLHNEEHLVLETSRADKFRPGDELLAIPRHICPTTALHREAYVVSEGKLVGCWPVTARDRRLTV